MADALRVGIVGCSGIAIAPGEDSTAGIRLPQPHSHAAAYHAVPGVVVTAVCDIFPEALARYAETWGAAASYTDYREMLERERLDLISIVTPDHLHADIFVAAAEAGVKGVFCEKPIATTLAEADRMIAAAERSGIKTVVNHTRRFDPFYRQARRLIEDGAIGEVRRLLGTLGGARAMLFRNGTHIIDTMLFFAAAEPAWVIAVLDDADAGYGPAYHGDGGRDPATEPGASALIGFGNGVRAFYNGSKGTATDFQIDVHGDAGRIRIGNQLAELGKALPSGGFSVQPLPAHLDLRSGMVVAVEELIAQVRADGDGVAALKAARTTLGVLLGILHSADQGGARVELPLTSDAG